jgi:hypothetical protein
VLVDLGSRFRIEFLDARAVLHWDWLVDTECELHTLDHTRFGVLACFTVAFLLGCALSYQVSRRVMFKVGSFKLLDAPKAVRRESGSKMRTMTKWTMTNLPFSLSSLSPIYLESFLNSRLDFALSESTIKFCKCQSLQLKFSSLWPCSR